MRANSILSILFILIRIGFAMPVKELPNGTTRYGALETAPGIENKSPYGFQELVLVGEGR